MSPSETATLIKTAGGDTAFGRLLGIASGKNWQQRINNWKRRGLPSEVELKHYDTIRSLRIRKTDARKSA